MATRSPLFDDIHDPRLADLVRAADRPSAAVLAPLAVAPRAQGFASSHRTARTQPTFAERADAVRNPSIPRSEPVRRIGRFAF